MALSIKNEEADRLARELADRTGEGLTEAIVVALRERLGRVMGQRTLWGVEDEIAAMQARVAALPLLDCRADEEILGYNETGAPT